MSWGKSFYISCAVSYLYHTAGSETIFFLIFTYFWLKFQKLWLKCSNVYFLKPDTNKGEFRLNFELFEKSCRGATTQKYKKTQKPWYLYYWHGLRSARGVKKNLTRALITLKTRHKTVTFDRFSWFYEVFQSLFNLSWILAQKTHQVIKFGPSSFFECLT